MATPPSGRPIAQVPSAAQEAALDRADRRSPRLRQTIAAAVAKAAAAYDDKADANQSEVVQRADFVWIDDALPPGASPQGDGPWDFVARPDHPVASGQLGPAEHGARTQAAVLRQRGAASSRSARATRFSPTFTSTPRILPRRSCSSGTLAGGWTHRAYWGQNVIDWGKDGTPERLRSGRLARIGQMGAAGGDGEETGAGAGHDDRRLGVHSARRNGLLGSGRHRDLDTPGGPAVRLIDSLDPGPSRRRRRRACPTDSRRSSGSNDPSGPTLRRKSYSLTSSSRRIPVPDPYFDPLHTELAKAEQERNQIDGQIPTTLVFRERSGEPRPAFMLNRGEYDQRRDKVGRATPAFLPPLLPGAPLNRLGLAQWLVAPNHPLTARVAVNRFWLQVFGTGLVKTAEDFGSQGEPPSHPELLDWLAVQFREDGWDVKRFMKRLVMSATYRQSSHVTPETLAKDPANRLLARGPRFRLDAETAPRPGVFRRRAARSSRWAGRASSRRNRAGLWEAVGYTDSNTAHFTADNGAEKVHRRSLYTFWKRTSPPPQMTTFDAPSREACLVRRERTNTPLQALLLLNEPQFVEAARALAERTLREAGPTTEERLAYMFRLATSRRPTPKELAELNTAFQDFDGSLRQAVRRGQGADHDRARPSPTRDATPPSWPPGR